MKMTFRWFGEKDDTVTLEQIRQIPGMSGIAGALYDVPVGEVWPLEEILALRNQVNAAGLEFEVVESVNVHEDIKLGLPSRDHWIENYRQSIRNLAAAGVKVVCYNFMPVFDWFRSDLAMPLPDGSNTMAYSEDVVKNLTPEIIMEQVESTPDAFVLPGWEPERLAELRGLLTQYRSFGRDQLTENLRYFLKAVIPVCEETGVRLAIHPDDPSWPIFGLPRIVSCAEDLETVVDAVDSPCNCLALCSGSLGSNPDNDIPALVRRFGSRGRIAFAHVRNVKHCGPHTFCEVAHLSDAGSLDLYEIMKAYHDVGFDGYMRPDHGRMIWGEKARPGYGLYDRALGAAYLNGLWEAVCKSGRG